MIYSSRLKKILEHCLMASDRYVPVDELAKELKTSRRTIFRELQDVDEQLQAYGVQVHSKSGQGIRIEGENTNKEALLEELHTQEIRYINKEERRNLLIFELLHSDEIEKLIHYANMFQVSEATISNDLAAIETWFTTRSIRLVRKPGSGIALEVSEENRRRAMTAIIQQTLQNSEDYRSIYYLDANLLLEQIFLRSDQNIMKLLNRTILERILQVFHQYQHELNLDRYAQTSYIGLIIHLVIAIDRILKHEELMESQEVLAMVQDDASYETASRMSALLETEFDIEIPAVETAFIALHIKGAKIMYVNAQSSSEEHEQQLQELIHDMIACYDEELRYPLLQDEEFLQGLITHLEPTIIRLQNDLPIYNPLLPQLCRQYPDLFHQTKKACAIMEQRYHCKVSDDEAGFLTMHVGASLERSHAVPLQRMVRVGVVCASGIGVSALMAARIANAFPQGIELRTVSMEQLAKHDYQHCELLISTFAIDQQELPFLQVNTLLSETDIEQIAKQLKELRKTLSIRPYKSRMQNFSDQLVALQKGATAALQVLHNFTIHEVGDQALLSDILQEAASHSLPKSEQATILLALQKREAMGSVILKDYGFAMLHAQSEGVQDCQVQILYPQTRFQQEAMLGIDFIFVLLLPKPHTKQQQELMSLLSRSLIEEETFCEALRQRQEEKTIDILQTLLQNYMETIEE